MGVNALLTAIEDYEKRRDKDGIGERGHSKS